MLKQRARRREEPGLPPALGSWCREVGGVACTSPILVALMAAVASPGSGPAVFPRHRVPGEKCIDLKLGLEPPREICKGTGGLPVPTTHWKVLGAGPLCKAPPRSAGEEKGVENRARSSTQCERQQYSTGVPWPLRGTLTSFQGCRGAPCNIGTDSREKPSDLTWGGIVLETLCPAALFLAS